MDKEVALEILKTPLYWLFHRAGAELSSGLQPWEIDDLRTGWSDQALRETIEALAWGMAHPEINYGSVLPRIPYDNAAIQVYFSRLHSQLSDLLYSRSAELP